LLVGETGTGKEVIAKALHACGHRASQRFVGVNCGTIGGNLVESELFGHEKGAFTGANKPRKGLFEQADGGTVFLDEVAELPAESQVKLLRVLEEKELQRIGADAPTKVDVRVISASNKDLLGLVKDGLFREDLYQRLGRYILRIPPLRQRKEDIGLLISFFLEKQTRDLANDPQARFGPLFTDRALDVAVRFDWPSNIRQLGNVFCAACIKSWPEPVDASHVITELIGGIDDAAGATAEQVVMLGRLVDRRLFKVIGSLMTMKRDRNAKKEKRNAKKEKRSAKRSRLSIACEDSKCGCSIQTIYRLLAECGLRQECFFSDSL